MNNVYLKIEGRVQRVGFRRWIVNKASELGEISGWVRNMNDRSVEILMCGNAEKINQLIQLCYTGPLLARVDKISLMSSSASLPQIKIGQFIKL